MQVSLKASFWVANTKTTPIKKDPIRLAIRVAQGNKATESFCIKTEMVYRPKEPKAPPKAIANRKLIFSIILIIFWDYIITECYSIIYNQAIYFSAFLLLD